MNSLYRFTVYPKDHKDNKAQHQSVYVVADSLLNATHKIAKVLAVDERILDCQMISEECYV